MVVTRKEGVHLVHISSQDLGRWQTKIAVFFIKLTVKALPYETSCPDIAAFYAVATKNVEQRGIPHSEAEHVKQ